MRYVEVLVVMLFSLLPATRTVFIEKFLAPHMLGLAICCSVKVSGLVVYTTRPWSAVLPHASMGTQ